MSKLVWSSVGCVVFSYLAASDYLSLRSVSSECKQQSEKPVARLNLVLDGRINTVEKVQRLLSRYPHRRFQQLKLSINLFEDWEVWVAALFTTAAGKPMSVLDLSVEVCMDVPSDNDDDGVFIQGKTNSHAFATGIGELLSILEKCHIKKWNLEMEEELLPLSLLVSHRKTSYPFTSLTRLEASVHFEDLILLPPSLSSLDIVVVCVDKRRAKTSLGKRHTIGVDSKEWRHLVSLPSLVRLSLLCLSWEWTTPWWLSLQSLSRLHTLSLIAKLSPAPLAFDHEPNVVDTIQKTESETVVPVSSRVWPSLQRLRLQMPRRSALGWNSVHHWGPLARYLPNLVDFRWESHLEGALAEWPRLTSLHYTQEHYMDFYSSPTILCNSSSSSSSSTLTFSLRHTPWPPTITRVVCQRHAPIMCFEPQDSLPHNLLATLPYVTHLTLVGYKLHIDDLHLLSATLLQLTHLSTTTCGIRDDHIATICGIFPDLVFWSIDAERGPIEAWNYLRYLTRLRSLTITNGARLTNKAALCLALHLPRSVTHLVTEKVKGVTYDVWESVYFSHFHRLDYWRLSRPTGVYRDRRHRFGTGLTNGQCMVDWGEAEAEEEEKEEAKKEEEDKE